MRSLVLTLARNAIARRLPLRTNIARSVLWGRADRQLCTASPDERHQAPGPRLVRPIRIAKMVNEHLFFGVDPIRVHEKEYECGGYGDEQVDRESTTEPHENRPDVSRMADEAVRPALDDGLRFSRSQRARVVTTEHAHRPDTDTEADYANGYADPGQR